jgi:hypothetical protein
MKLLMMPVVCALAITFCFAADASTSFALKSNAFADGATIPNDDSYDRMGCTGKNESPELHWSGVPAKTKTLALTVFDPDANNGKGWWHWVVYNIDPSEKGLDEGERPPGTEGKTDFGSPGYGGPCPPSGDTPHHYVFTLYALNVSLRGKLDGPELLDALKDHVIGKAVLVGRFGR